MKKLFVYYEGWGERWLLGTLADDSRKLLFEYSADALQQGLQLSPYKLPLQAQAFGDFPAYLFRLPGLIADSLPDGWGLLLMDKVFRQLGRNPATLSPLDRLAYLHGRAMGALTFEPSDWPGLDSENVELLELAKEAKTLIEGHDSKALKKMALMGGSPHGARPKVLVYYNPASGSVSTQAFADATPWLVKFQAQSEHKEVCAVEMLYAALARECQLDVPDTAYFDLDKKLSAFGIERFDIKLGMRVPVHTLAGALHADFRTPGATDYLMFLRVVRLFTKDMAEVQKAYQRCIFNVLFNNRDDHPKNFSFLLSQSRQWKLAPCYDLSFNEGPGGEHQMDILGHGKSITRAHLLALAEKADLDKTWAATTIDRMLDASRVFKTYSQAHPIRPPTRKTMQQTIEANARLLSR